MIEKVNKDWSLFLDRDGVINKLLPNQYVKTLTEWEYTEGGLEAVVALTQFFKHTFVVTNQQGIGKGIMTEGQLAILHKQLHKDVEALGGKIDKIYYAPQLATQYHSFRKPRTGMAKQAQKDFPQVDFKKSIMVGDFVTDMLFAKKLGMAKVFIHPEKKAPIDVQVEYCFNTLAAFTAFLLNSNR